MFKKYFMVMLVVFMTMVMSTTVLAKNKETKRINGLKLLEVIKEDMEEYDDGDFTYELYENQEGDGVRIEVDHLYESAYIHYYFGPEGAIVYIKDSDLWDKVVFGNDVINAKWYDDVYNGKIDMVHIVVDNL